MIIHVIYKYFRKILIRNLLKILFKVLKIFKNKKLMNFLNKKFYKLEKKLIKILMLQI